MNMKKKYYLSIIIFILLVFFDQITKYIIVNNFKLNESLILINNFLKFQYINNYGASFGILNGQVLLLVIITIIILYYLIIELKKNKNNNLLLTSFTLIISGSIGNLIDRLFRGYVVDFISFTLFKREMPIFNLADIFITFGVLLYLYIILMEGKYERNSNKRRK